MLIRKSEWNNENILKLIDGTILRINIVLATEYFAKTGIRVSAHNILCTVCCKRTLTINNSYFVVEVV